MSDELEAKEYERRLNRRQDRDDLPVQITVRQAWKIAAIMGAVAKGNSSYIEALRHAQLFLDAVVAEGDPGTVNSPDPAKKWADVDAWSWPQRGVPAERTD